MSRPTIVRIAAPSFLPLLTVPTGWSETSPPSQSSRMFVHMSGLKVMASVDIDSRGHSWAHVSMSRAASLPTWADLRKVRDEFLPRDRAVVQVFPPEGEYVNMHPFVLHLWSDLSDHGYLPDFRFQGAL